MSFILATQVRVGMIIVFEGELCRVISVEHQTPGNLPARIQTKMKRLKDGINRENRFGSADKIDKASLEQIKMEYLYEDGDHLVFMNNETYEQIGAAPRRSLGTTWSSCSPTWKWKWSSTTARRCPWPCPPAWSWRSWRPNPS